MESVNSRQLTAEIRGGTRGTPMVVNRRQPAIMLTAVIGLILVLLWWFDPADVNVPLCSFHTLTGLECPGCGATRATHELLHGRVAAAFRYNALWVLSLPLVIYVGISELRVLSGRRPLPGDLPRRIGFWLCMTAAALAFFVVRNLPSGRTMRSAILGGAGSYARSGLGCHTRGEALGRRQPKSLSKSLWEPIQIQTTVSPSRMLTAPTAQGPITPLRRRQWSYGGLPG